MFRFLRTTPLVVFACLVLASRGETKDQAPTCNGDFGTTIQFLDTPQEASTAAKKDGKLVFVLHVSGHFEKPEFT